MKNEAWLDHIDETQHRISSIDNEQVRGLLPEMNLQYKRALWAPTDGRAEPQRTAPAIARAVQAKGAAVLTNCAVRNIEVSGGKIIGVETERGRISTPAVVVAGGAWSRLLLKGIGVTLPQLKVVNSVLRTEPVHSGPQITVRGHFFSVRLREDGGYTISTLVANDHDLTPDSFRFLRDFVPVLKREWRSVRPRIGHRFFQEWRDMQRIRPGRLSPYEKTRILDPKPNVAMSNAALGHLAQAFPAFRNAKVAQHWAGVIDFTPDVVPVISNVDSVAGLTIATGFSGHGFGLGLGAGRLTADLVTGQTPIVDPTPFRFSRFTDGSKMIPLTGV